MRKFIATPVIALALIFVGSVQVSPDHSNLVSGVASGGTGFTANTTSSFSSGKLLSLQNAGAEKLSVDYRGAIVSSAPGGSNALSIASGAAIAFGSNQLYFDGTNMQNGAGLINGATVAATSFTANPTTNAVLLSSQVADSATAVGIAIDTTATLATAGAKLLSVRDHGTEQAFVDLHGGIRAGTTLSTCGSTTEGMFQVKVGGGGTPTKVCWCENTGSGTYQWASESLNTGAWVTAGGSTTVCP